ncbi:TonB-dependent receptor [Hyphomonas polymorpha PS728]|uniref:TonB-dependent receptor n=1 Tax=Hyphomonas polymorpha PS728 TaxID=1280954 RepID=A0A062VK55_9PROT|nr:catecholate siderophore receptor Fiu [Hyphomonas polymorpha]KCZ98974.1 TonB-dependent receptor [Hyphomonas polymorpha PS728]
MIRSGKHGLTTSLALIAALSGPLAAHAEADDARNTDPEKREETVVVEGETLYIVPRVSSPKLTQELVNTPQTISVISGHLIADQGAVSLMEALRNTPGITMQLGENGNTSSGDTFTMRGFSSQSSIFQDGIRDLGAVTRDSFNLEQIEVAKGPAGSDIGRGASSGYINQVSKTPRADDFTALNAGATTEGGVRLTGDANKMLGETTGVRLNVMVQDMPVPGRDEVTSTGYGIAPSIAFGIGTGTEFQLFGQHIVQDNVPDGGIPSIGLEGFYNANADLRAGAAVDPSNFYGSSADYEDVEANMITAKVIHDLGGGLTLTNTSRYGKTQMDRVLTGINALSAPSSDPATWTVSRSRQRVDQTNEILGNQTILTGSFTTGRLVHDFSTGLEALYESQKSLSFSTTGLTIPAAPLYNPSANVSLAVPYATGAETDGSTTTLAAFLFDTVKLDEKWFFTAGLRAENYDIDYDAVSVSTATSHPALPVGTLVPTSITADGSLVSWKLAALYKPRENGSVYISYGNALTPPGGANFSLSSSESSINNPAFDPQETESLEVGTKWDLFGEHLAVSAAYYSTTNKDELAVLDPGSNTYEQLGERKVEGIELSAVGKLTQNWQISAGLTTMDTEVTEGTTGNNTQGAAARWSPDLSATVWSTYKLTPAFTFGGGARYTGEQKRVVNPATDISTQNVPVIPEAWVVDAMARYEFSEQLALQLNVYNLFDEDYISTLNNSGARLTPGQPLTAYLSLNVRF